MSITTKELDAARASHEQKKAITARTPTHTYELVKEFLVQNATKAFKIDEIQTGINEIAAKHGLVARGIADVALATEGLVKSGVLKSYAGHYAIAKQQPSEIPVTEDQPAPTHSTSTSALYKGYDTNKDVTEMLDRINTSFAAGNFTMTEVIRPVVQANRQRHADLRAELDRRVSSAGGAFREGKTIVFAKKSRLTFLKEMPLSLAEQKNVKPKIDVRTSSFNQSGQETWPGPPTKTGWDIRREKTVESIWKHVVGTKKAYLFRALCKIMHLGQNNNNYKSLIPVLKKQCPEGYGITEYISRGGKRQLAIGPAGMSVALHAHSPKSLMRMILSRRCMNEFYSRPSNAGVGRAEFNARFKTEILPGLNAAILAEGPQLEQDIVSGKAPEHVFNKKVLVLGNGYYLIDKRKSAVTEIGKMSGQVLGGLVRQKIVKSLVVSPTPLGEMSPATVEKQSHNGIPNLVASYYSGFSNKEALQRVMGTLAYFGRIAGPEFNKEYGQDKWDSFVMRTLTCVDAVELALEVPKGSVQFRNGELVCSKSILPN